MAQAPVSVDLRHWVLPPPALPHLVHALQNLPQHSVKKAAGARRVAQRRQ